MNFSLNVLVEPSRWRRRTELRSRFAALFFFILAFVAGESARAEVAPANAEAAITKAAELGLGHDPFWLKVGHYKKGFFGSYESEVANPLFFVDANGRKDPEAELRATLRKGFSGEILPPAGKGAPAMAVRCQYPARWKWLRAKLNIDDSLLPKVTCKDYDTYITRMGAAGVTLVFSGYYVNNPSSAFGHVFLRLDGTRHEHHKRPETGHSDYGQNSHSGAELLDYGVGYAANATTSSAFFYALYSVIGLLPGTFSSMPYYYKVREYSDAESRDLWEYDLDLKPQEMEVLVDAIWEIGSTYFDYSYATANCAYQLLYLLETAAPRLHLIDRMPPYEIPVDALKAVTAEPGLVMGITYRPSTLRQLEVRYNSLTFEEKNKFFKVRKEAHPEQMLEGLSPESSAKVLDTVLDDIDFRYFTDLNNKTNPEVKDRKQNVLLARARLPAGGQVTVDVADADRPDRGHPSGRYSLGFGYQSDPSFNSAAIDGEFRFAIHDITDRLEGYLPYATVEMGRFQFRWLTAVNQFNLQALSVFNMSSLAPYSRLESNYSWRFGGGLERVRDRRCDNCQAADLYLMGGLSAQPIDGLLIYGLFGGVGEASTSFAQDQWIPDLSGTGGIRFKPFRVFQIDAEGEWRRVFDLQTFDRLAGTVKARWDFGEPDQSPFALQLEYTAEVSSSDVFLRYLRYF